MVARGIPAWSCNFDRGTGAQTQGKRDYVLKDGSLDLRSRFTGENLMSAAGVTLTLPGRRSLVVTGGGISGTDGRARFQDTGTGKQRTR